MKMWLSKRGEEHYVSPFLTTGVPVIIGLW